MRAVEVSLHDGQVAVVDEKDWPRVRSLNWTHIETKGCHYAMSGRTYMHRLIAGAGVDEEVDHRDGDGLNNRRSNLRLAVHALNLANQRPQAGRSSRFKGVSLYPRLLDGKPCFEAYIKVNGVKLRLGYFNDEEEAARAYDAAALEAWGEFARLNFEAVMA